MRKNGGKVLVHCHAGISRSATVCIAYIMWLKHWTMECAYQFLKSKRSLIAPNLNFMRQLVEFENELEENGRGGGGNVSGGHASTSSTSSSSSYASAVSCLDCGEAGDVLTSPTKRDVGDVACETCVRRTASVTSEGSACALLTPSPRMTSSLRHHDSNTSLDSVRSDIFSSPCQFRHHHPHSHYSHHNKSPYHHNASAASKHNTATSPNAFSFDLSHVTAHPTLSAPPNLHPPTAPPKSASAAALLSATLAPTGGVAMDTMDATGTAPTSARPATAHPALFSLPLTTCAAQVFSFDSPICSPAIHAQHTNSPTLCHSPLLSPG